MNGKKSFTVEQIAKLTQSDIKGDPSKVITNVADLESADEHDASFLANPRYEGAMKKSKAGVIFIDPSSPQPDGKTYLLNQDPSRAFQAAVELFCPQHNEPASFKGIHATAVIHPTASLGAHVTIGPYAVIDEGAIIGENTQIGSHAFIGPHSRIGTDTHIYPHVTVRERTQIGSRVIIQPGAVIGSCGFGYTQDHQGRHIKLNQIGIVVIEDDVEIGANTTIDRSRFKETRISRGSKIDNLVQIGHGVTIGPDNIVIAQTGIAGSTSTGRHVILAGQTAIAGHIHITDNVVVAAKSGVSKSIEKPGKYNGIPTMPLEEYNRNTVYLRSIHKIVARLKSLEEKLKGS
jgi:UDP-3-O-[3-hydroxymyristoyl] glucosamine N-acyltransferase